MGLSSVPYRVVRVIVIYLFEHFILMRFSLRVKYEMNEVLPQGGQF